MVVRANIHISLSAGLEKSVLESLNANLDAVLLEVGINDSPRLGVVASDAALEQEIENDTLGSAGCVVCDSLLDCLEKWHRVGVGLLVDSFAFVHRTRVATPNDPKLSDGGAWRGSCEGGAKKEATDVRQRHDRTGRVQARIAATVTRGAVRCSAWLGVIDAMLDAFDWEQVKRVMDALDWKYGSGEEAHRPTFAEMRRTAKNHLLCVAESAEYPYSTHSGGFLAEAFAPGKFDLYFVIESVCDEDVEAETPNENKISYRRSAAR